MPPKRFRTILPSSRLRIWRLNLARDGTSTPQVVWQMNTFTMSVDAYRTFRLRAYIMGDGGRIECLSSVPSKRSVKVMSIGRPC